MVDVVVVVDNEDEYDDDDDEAEEVVDDGLPVVVDCCCERRISSAPVAVNAIRIMSRSASLLLFPVFPLVSFKPWLGYADDVRLKRFG